jgi:hypothetical protein
MTLDPAAKRERAQRLATDYSASQRERDQQDRNRGAQRTGFTTEGKQSLNRQIERMERPTLSETTADQGSQEGTRMNSNNSLSGRPKAEAARSEKLRNRSEISFKQADPWG